MWSDRRRRVGVVAASSVFAATAVYTLLAAGDIGPQSPPHLEEWDRNYVRLRVCKVYLYTCELNDNRIYRLEFTAHGPSAVTEGEELDMETLRVEQYEPQVGPFDPGLSVLATRWKSEAVAQAFKRALDGGEAFGVGADSHFPDELNFFFAGHLTLYVDAARAFRYRCSDVVLGQGSTSVAGNNWCVRNVDRPLAAQLPHTETVCGSLSCAICHTSSDSPTLSVTRELSQPPPPPLPCMHRWIGGPHFKRVANKNAVVVQCKESERDKDGDWRQKQDIWMALQSTGMYANYIFFTLCVDPMSRPPSGGNVSSICKLEADDDI